MKNYNRILMAMMLVATLSSCHIYNKYELPENNEIINSYNEALNAEIDSTSLGNLEWHEVFSDPLLQVLINKALENNKDYKNAKLNVDIAHAQLKGAKLSYLPSVSLNPNGGASSYAGSQFSWTYTLPLAVSWEIDVFGKTLNNKRYAEANLNQIKAYTQAVRSQIIGAVANTYYSLVMLNEQLNVTQQTAVLWKEQVETMELMKEAGRTNEAAVVQSRANYYNILSTIPSLEASIHEVQNIMSLLLNTYPQEWQVTNSLEFVAPGMFEEGIPITYLAARPDIRAAEQGLASAYYATNKARSNFYPSLVISAQGGFTNLLGSIISNPGEWFLQLAGSLSAPLFSRGQNIATLEATKAQQKQALNAFEYSILNASVEVSNALMQYNKNNEKSILILKQIEQLNKSVEYTNELFKLGKATYLELLTAEQNLLSAQLARLNCWYSKMSAVINLYQSLGGGR